jgi:hypothetical protein
VKHRIKQSQRYNQPSPVKGDVDDDDWFMILVSHMSEKCAFQTSADARVATAFTVQVYRVWATVHIYNEQQHNGAKQVISAKFPWLLNRH